MSYCNIGDTPKVTYSFGGQSTPSVYISSESPIEVIANDLGSLANGGQGVCIIYNYYWEVDFHRRSDDAFLGRSGYTSSGGPSDKYAVRGPVTGIRTRLEPRSAHVEIACRGKANELCTSSTVWREVFAAVTNNSFKNAELLGFYSTAPNSNLGPAPPQTEIIVTANGLTIFNDQGNTPCTFTVQCGDCPPGTTKCNSPGYPGYCCIPCNSMAQRINNLANKL